MPTAGVTSGARAMEHDQGTCVEFHTSRILPDVRPHGVKQTPPWWDRRVIRLGGPGAARDTTKVLSQARGAGRVPQVTLRMYCRRRVGMCARMVLSKHRHDGTGVLNGWAGRVPQVTLRKYCRKRVGQHGSKISSANSVSKLFGDSWEGQ